MDKEPLSHVELILGAVQHKYLLPLIHYGVLGEREKHPTASNSKTLASSSSSLDSKEVENAIAAYFENTAQVFQFLHKSRMISRLVDSWPSTSQHKQPSPAPRTQRPDTSSSPLDISERVYRTLSLFIHAAMKCYTFSCEKQTTSGDKLTRSLAIRTLFTIIETYVDQSPIHWVVRSTPGILSTIARFLSPNSTSMASDSSVLCIHILTIVLRRNFNNVQYRDSIPHDSLLVVFRHLFHSLLGFSGTSDFQDNFESRESHNSMSERSLQRHWLWFASNFTDELNGNTISAALQLCNVILHAPASLTYASVSDSSANSSNVSQDKELQSWLLEYHKTTEHNKKDTMEKGVVVPRNNNFAVSNPVPSRLFEYALDAYVLLNYFQYRYDLIPTQDKNSQLDENTDYKGGRSLFDPSTNTNTSFGNMNRPLFLEFLRSRGISLLNSLVGVQRKKLPRDDTQDFLLNYTSLPAENTLLLFVAYCYCSNLFTSSNSEMVSFSHLSGLILQCSQWVTTLHASFQAQPKKHFSDAIETPLIQPSSKISTKLYESIRITHETEDFSSPSLNLHLITQTTACHVLDDLVALLQPSSEVATICVDILEDIQLWRCAHLGAIHILTVLFGLCDFNFPVLQPRLSSLHSEMGEGLIGYLLSLQHLWGWDISERLFYEKFGLPSSLQDQVDRSLESFQETNSYSSIELKHKYQMLCHLLHFLGTAGSGEEAKTHRSIRLQCLFRVLEYIECAVPEIQRAAQQALRRISTTDRLTSFLFQHTDYILDEFSRRLSYSMCFPRTAQLVGTFLNLISQPNVWTNSTSTKSVDLDSPCVPLLLDPEKDVEDGVSLVTFSSHVEGFIRELLFGPLGTSLPDFDKTTILCAAVRYFRAVILTERRKDPFWIQHHPISPPSTTNPSASLPTLSDTSKSTENTSTPISPPQPFPNTQTSETQKNSKIPNPYPNPFQNTQKSAHPISPPPPFSPTSKRLENFEAATATVRNSSFSSVSSASSVSSSSPFPGLHPLPPSPLSLSSGSLLTLWDALLSPLPSATTRSRVETLKTIRLTISCFLTWDEGKGDVTLSYGTQRERGEKSQKEREEKESKTRNETEAKMQKQTEETPQKETKERSQNEAEAKTQNETEAKVQKQTEETPQKETKERSQNEAEAKTQNETEAKIQKQTEETPQKETKERSQNEAEAKTQNETEAKDQKQTEETPQKETKERSQNEAEAKTQNETEAKIQKQTEETPQNQTETKTRPQIQTEEKFQIQTETETKPQNETEAKTQNETEEKTKPPFMHTSALPSIHRTWVALVPLLYPRGATTEDDVHRVVRRCREEAWERGELFPPKEGIKGEKIEKEGEKGKKGEEIKVKLETKLETINEIRMKSDLEEDTTAEEEKDEFSYRETKFLWAPTIDSVVLETLRVLNEMVTHAHSFLYHRTRVVLYPLLEYLTFSLIRWRKLHLRVARPLVKECIRCVTLNEDLLFKARRNVGEGNGASSEAYQKYLMWLWPRLCGLARRFSIPVPELANAEDR